MLWCGSCCGGVVVGVVGSCGGIVVAVVSCESGNCYFYLLGGFQLDKSVFYSQICSNTL